MDAIKKCDECNREMQKGWLTNHGMVWVNKLFTGIGFLRAFTGGKLVNAWSCQKCGKILLYSETK